MKLYNNIWCETLFYLFGVAILYYNQFIGWNGEYLDTDCFFHALRMIQWFENPSFFEQKMWWSNYPFGEISHWTKVIYIVWGMFTLPFLFFYSLKDAVFNAGLIICPFFLSLSVVFLVKVLRKILSFKCRLLVFALLFVQSNFMRVSIFYRPDHHVMFVFATVFIFYLVSLFIDKKDDKLLKLMAITLACCLWLAVEGVFLFVGVAGFLYVSYLFLGYKYEYLRKLCLWYVIGICACVIVNPCYQGWFYLDTGRISLFYVIVFGGLFTFVESVKNIDNKVKQTAMLVGLVSGFVLILFALGWIKNPVDERLNDIFIARITEMKGIDIYTGAYPFVGLLIGGIIFKKHFRDEIFVYLYVSLVLFSLLTFLGIRFLQYSGFYAAVIIALFVHDRVIEHKKVMGFVMFFVLLEFISFIANLLVFSSVLAKPAPNIYFYGLNNLPKGSVVTDTFFAPHMIWFGQRPVVASPYHGNVEGILDNHEILFSSDENKVIELIKKHKVGSIYLTKEVDTFYVNPKENCDKLYGKILGCKNYPKWLKLIDNTNGAMFEVDYKQL